MKKRCVAAVLAALLFCSALAFPAGAAKHEHTFDEGVIVSEPDCWKNGSIKYTCTDENCTYTYYESIPSLGHLLDEGVITKRPTCAENGSRTYCCLRDGCDFMTTRMVSFLGHRLEKEKVVSLPSCTQPGMTLYVCRHEGCHYQEQIWFPAIGHRMDNGAVTRTPDCTHEGRITYSCTRDGCGYSYTTSIAPLGHDWQDPVVTKEATENSYGTRTWSCSRCDKVKTETIPEWSHIFYVWFTYNYDYHLDRRRDVPIRADGELEFTVTIEEGYEPGPDFEVVAQSAQIDKLENGNYIISHVEDNTTIFVKGIVKKDEG